MLDRIRLHCSEVNPCMRCGACCAAFIVRFPAVEMMHDNGGWVPEAFATSIDGSICAMKGTELKHKRCTALEGQIGHRVTCTIYVSRPTVCRSFEASWQEGARNYHCDRARALYGLAPFDYL
ncbi:MAG: YkgJ family cysteine cluster protein [Deltaproteobacteria bacterium]|nr:YkgJ family cysteine cluster protein [Deltaproteobacteria bacterium]